MITLRKDVRLGLMIGGILLAVSGVYLMLSMVGSKPETATLDDGTNTTGIDIAKAAPAKTETKPTIVANNKKPADQPKQAEPKNPVAPAANEDLWSIAFNNGEVKSNVTRTENPLNRSTDPKVKNDAIDSINRAMNGEDSNNSTPPKSASNSDASTPSSTEPKPAGEARTYVIQSGDTFSSIALDHYGDARFYKLIADANPKVDPTRMKLGTTITIPPLPDSNSRIERDDTTDVPADSFDPAKQYRVQIGDSLHSIAARLYGNSQMWSKIYDLNKAQIGENPAKLKLNMVLVLPSAPTQ